MLSFKGPASLLIGSAVLAVSPAPAGQPRSAMQDPLAFPIATAISAAKQAPAFAWLVRHGEKSRVLFAHAPAFKPVTLFARPDTDGQPVTDVDLSPDGRYVVFQTAAPYAGERAYNPAGLIDAPKPTLWAMETREGARPVQIGTGTGASFAPQGHTLVYRYGADLWTVDLGEPKPDSRLLAKGGASFADAGWTKDGKSLVFVQDRGGYSFLGRFEPGSAQIDWLVTGPDRLLSPTVSPDGSMIAYLRFPGRQNDVVRDSTESEPFAVELLELASGKVRTLWETRDKGVLARLEDPDSALRWVAGRLVFYSEHDGWGRLYSVSPKGGDARPLTSPKCEVAESEPTAGDALLVIHNCGDLDTRQMSWVDVRTGQERRLRSDDLVLSKAASGGESGFLVMPAAAPIFRRCFG
jgi:dipeptidyl aminopeptidase/acylaminoacyl peptidase